MNMGKHSYAVILDAGSSGTRVYVYNWKKAAYVRTKEDAHDLAELPKIKTHKDWRLKVHPGVSTFGNKPELVGPEHLAPLLTFALDVVPREEVPNTPIFVLATAGMRLLPDMQRSQLLGHICAYFRRESRFQLPDCDLHVQVIPGETEGLYGWIAANYLLGGFDAPGKHDHGKGHHTYGFLDMGGASAQIAFAPNSTETQRHANDLKLLRLRTMDGNSLEYRVFVTTWLGFGANEARRRYVESLIDLYPAGRTLPDPCLPVGLQVNKTGYELLPTTALDDSDTVRIKGTGQFPECLKRTYPLLQKEEPCKDPPCLLNGIHTPAIDFDVNHFVGVSEYWHTTHELFAMAHKDKAYDLFSYQKQVTDLCSRKWDDIKLDVKKHKWGDKVDEKTVEEVCFKASWLINMLHDGIGIPRVGLETDKQTLTGSANKTNAIVDSAKDRGFLDAFQAVDKIDGTEVSWTLGKIVLYASSQVPAAAPDDDPVGFGSNRPGVAIPFDFQYPSAANSSLASQLSAVDDAFGADDDKDWHDRIFHSDYSRRVPGILIFLLILVLALYLMCGRERRANIWNKIISHGNNNNRRPGLKRRKAPGFLGGKLFGSTTGGPSYERVDHDVDDGDMELGDVLGSLSESVHSDEGTSPPRTGRTSGVATPAIRGLSPDVTRASSKSKGYFDRTGAPAFAAAHGLGISRLGPRSRNTSPTRLAKSPLPTPYASHTPYTPFKTVVD